MFMKYIASVVINFSTKNFNLKLDGVTFIKLAEIPKAGGKWAREDFLKNM